MPITFAHPAILLPLKKIPQKYISWSALICGAIAPDFQYFYSLKSFSIHTHQWDLSFCWNILIGLLLLGIFHLVIKEVVLHHFISGSNEQIKNLRTMKWFKKPIKTFPILVISCTIGSFSHLFWDGFTHEYGFALEHFPILSESISLWKFKFPLYNVLQHFSGLLGTYCMWVSVKHELTKRGLKIGFYTIEAKQFLIQLMVSAGMIWLMSIQRIELFHLIIHGFGASITAIVFCSILYHSKKLILQFTWLLSTKNTFRLRE